MATKKKAAKKKATKKSAPKSFGVASILQWNPRRGGDPPPPFFNKLDTIAQKQFVDFVNKLAALARGQR